MNTLIQKHYDDLKTIAKKICGSAKHEDILHDTILKCLENGLSVDTGEELQKYFAVALRNAYINQSIKDTRNQKRQVNFDESLPIFATETIEDYELQRKLVTGELLDPLKAEFGPKVEFFALYYFHAFTYQEIEELTGTNQKTVADWVQKIARYLTDTLRKDGL